MPRRLPLVLLLGLLAHGAAGAGNLADAARERDRTAVLELLAQRADVAARDSTGATALHWAVHHDDVDLVLRLLRARADARAVSDYGATPLSEAAVVGNPQVITPLLKAGADPDSRNAKGQTALMVIARTANVAAAKALLRRGADVNAAEAVRGQTALMWAAAQAQPEMVRELLAHGADPNARTFVNEDLRQVSGEPRAQYRSSGGLTPLLFAARQGCLDCAKALVAKGARIDDADPEGVTPLIVAVNNFHFDTAAWLLEQGADPDLWDWWGRSALYLAVDLNTVPRGGRADMPSLDKVTSLGMIERLLKAGANPNLQLKLLPPYRAVGADRGADTMLSIGTTPLIRAAKAGDVDAIRLLLAHGANPHLPQAGGITPLMAAAGVGSTNIDTRGSLKTQPQLVASLQALLAAGARVADLDRQGRTALHGAAFWGYDDVVRLLASNGAPLDARDARGLTPLDHALGKAGGQGRGGQGVVVQESTAALLRELAGRAGHAPATVSTK